jgi:5-methyltetrahydrofolate--homocysteine methyltransferase
MSGLLVKSTLIMRENLEELNERGLADIPVLLGGAALTRTYVERDLREVYEGRLFYGKDAFEGLHVMDRSRRAQAQRRRRPRVRPGAPTRRRRSRRGPRRARRADDAGRPAGPLPEVVTDNPVFTPPFLGSKVVKGISLDEIAAYVNETALFRNQWQFRPRTPTGRVRRRVQGPHPPVLREELAKAKAAGLLVPQVVYGYFPANGDGDDLVIWTDESRTAEWLRFRFPRQHARRRSSASPTSSGRSSRARSTTPRSTSSPWAAP